MHTVYFLSLKHTFSNLPKGKVVGEKTIDMEEVGDNKQWVDVWVHYGNFTSFMADIIGSIQEDQWLLPINGTDFAFGGSVFQKLSPNLKTGYQQKLRDGATVTRHYLPG